MVNLFWLIDKQRVDPSRIISYSEVRESYSFFVHIYIFFLCGCYLIEVFFVHNPTEYEYFFKTDLFDTYMGL